MEKKRILRILGIILFVFGVFFSIDYHADITGAVIGDVLSPSTSSLIGIFLMIAGLVLFATSKFTKAPVVRTIDDVRLEDVINESK